VEFIASGGSEERWSSPKIQAQFTAQSSYAVTGETPPIPDLLNKIEIVQLMVPPSGTEDPLTAAEEMTPNELIRMQELLDEEKESCPCTVKESRAPFNLTGGVEIYYEADTTSENCTVLLLDLVYESDDEILGVDRRRLTESWTSELTAEQAVSRTAPDDPDDPDDPDYPFTPFNPDDTTITTVTPKENVIDLGGAAAIVPSLSLLAGALFLLF